LLKNDRASGFCLGPDAEEADMATIQKRKALIWTVALVLVMACAVPSMVASPTQQPVVDPGLINTLIAQTANAALTSTAAALPSATPTPIVTPTRPTDTPAPTATSTVIFVFFTPTARILPTFTAESSDANFACQVTKVSPPNGSVFNPRDDFDAFWTVRNIGKRNWDRNDVDYLYSSGAKIHKVSGYDLEENVAINRSLNLGVDMRAPKDPGTYSTVWTMRRGDRTFCELRLTIVVREE
jgi:hypothetical protein